jgi:hypothetical protein
VGAVVDVPPLVNEAMRKAGVVWLRPVGAGRATAVWTLWRDGAAYVVTGPGEQPVPADLMSPGGGAGCDVVVRSSDGGGRIVAWRARVSGVAVGSEEWDAVVPALVGKRLNLPDQQAAASRWAAECAVLRLDPTGELPEAGGSLPDGSLAEPPAPSPARTAARRPFTVGRATRRR